MDQTVPLSDYAKDTFVAPELSKLTECNAIDMTRHNPQCKHWVANFALNSMLRVNVANPHRAYIFMFLRRAEMSFHEHENGRLSLQNYIYHRSQRKDAIDLFLRAVYHFENFMAQSYQAFLIMRKMTGEDFFAKGDGSVLERLSLLHGRSKHAENTINSEQLPTDATIPVWLSNGGLCAENIEISYNEMAEILKDVSTIADRLSNPEPPAST
ncbi:MAG: hypothetical protein WD000_02615 [Thermodesulfobacteriota bacterium]